MATDCPKINMNCDLWGQIQTLVMSDISKILIGVKLNWVKRAGKGCCFNLHTPLHIMSKKSKLLCSNALLSLY